MDVRRTDRTQPLFALPNDGTVNENAAQAASNEHVDRLGTILLTYNFYEKELGKPCTCPPLRLWLNNRWNRLCARHVGPVCTDICGLWSGRSADVLVFRAGYGPYGTSLIHLSL